MPRSLNDGGRDVEGSALISIAWLCPGLLLRNGALGGSNEGPALEVSIAFRLRFPPSAREVGVSIPFPEPVLDISATGGRRSLIWKPWENGLECAFEKELCVVKGSASAIEKGSSAASPLPCWPASPAFKPESAEVRGAEVRGADVGSVVERIAASSGFNLKMLELRTLIPLTISCCFHHG